MTGPAAAPETGHPQDMLGQTAVVIGGSAGIGLETARLARAHGADVVLTARDQDRLRDAADQVDARSTAAFDVTDLVRLEQFFEELPGPIDHIMVTGPGPYYSSLADMDFEAARRDVGDRIVTTLAIARDGAARMRPPGTLLFMGGTGGRRAGVGMTVIGDDRSDPGVDRQPGGRAGADRATSSPLASWTRPCRRRYLATSSTLGGPSSAPRSPIGRGSGRPMSPRWRCTCKTNTSRAPARPTTSTAANSSCPTEEGPDDDDRRPRTASP